MRDVEDEDDEDEVKEELDPESGLNFLSVSLYIDRNCPEDEEDEEPGASQEFPSASGSKDANSQLTVGYKGDRSYVVRGNNIGVFNHIRDGVKYYATISNIATPKGKGFKPKQVPSLFIMEFS